MRSVSENLQAVASSRVSSKRGWRVTAARMVLLSAVVWPLASCTSGQTAGQASSYLILQSLEGANGAEPDKLGGTFESDVVTLVNRQVDGKQVQSATIFADPGAVTFRLGMKDPSLSPTSSNFITVNRYRVQYIRSDGRNTPGVDVPYPFDGAITMTVTDSVVKAGFTLVRIQAKEEAPLKQMAFGGGAIAISAIAEVTFYGNDQAGREVSAVGRILVTFADWGDPATE